MTASSPTRRRILFGATAVIASSGVIGAKWFNIFADASLGDQLSVTDAHEMAAGGAIYLIDIRRPDEWARTGIAEHAIPLDMRREDFTEALRAIFDAMGARPVALICARGVRSRVMTGRLTEAGFTQILDVPEGMLGSGAGPGYIKTGLPLRTWDGA